MSAVPISTTQRYRPMAWMLPLNNTQIQVFRWSNTRFFPSRFSSFRGQNLNLWDVFVLERIKLYEGLDLELRGEFLNAFNHVQFNYSENNLTNANFGRITGQANLPRNVQIGLKLIF